MTQVDSTRNYEQPVSGHFTLSNDGTRLIFVPSYSSQAVSVDTTTDTLSNLELSSVGPGSSVAIQQDGTVWMAGWAR